MSATVDALRITEFEKGENNMSDSVEKKRLKFLHCSDIHLDNPFVGLSGEKSEERRRELRAAFMRLMEFIRERAIDYVLISGDLFETAFVTNTTTEILIREFRNCPDTRFIIAPGLHDAYSSNPVYLSGRLPDNCYVFSSDSLSRFDFDEDRLTVYGWAFVKDRIEVSPLYDKHIDDSSKINIVLGYAELDGEIDSPICPISTSDLKKFGADYYALGSRHAKTEIAKRAGYTYSYCGSLECTGFDKPDVGGVWMVTITPGEEDSDQFAVEYKHFAFGHIRFITEQIDITGVNANNEIINRISRLISSRKYGIETALRVELVGDVAPDFIVPAHLECDAFGLYYFDMVDKTMPLYGTEHYMRDMSVAGEVYRRLHAMLTSENEEDRLIAARAFRVALASLEGKETEQ